MGTYYSDSECIQSFSSGKYMSGVGFPFTMYIQFMVHLKNCLGFKNSVLSHVLAQKLLRLQVLMYFEMDKNET